MMKEIVGKMKSLCLVALFRCVTEYTEFRYKYMYGQRAAVTCGFPG